MSIFFQFKTNIIESLKTKWCYFNYIYDLEMLSSFDKIEVSVTFLIIKNLIFFQIFYF